MVSLQIKPNTYYDSITLMIISKELKKVPGVKEALVGMGTDLNLDIAKVTGLSSPELEAITPNDFFVALDCENEEAVKRLSAWLDEIVLDLSTPPAEVFVGHWIHTGDFITLQRATM